MLALHDIFLCSLLLQAPAFWNHANGFGSTGGFSCPRPSSPLWTPVVAERAIRSRRRRRVLLLE